MHSQGIATYIYNLVIIYHMNKLWGKNNGESGESNSIYQSFLLIFLVTHMSMQCGMNIQHLASHLNPYVLMTCSIVNTALDD